MSLEQLIQENTEQLKLFNANVNRLFVKDGVSMSGFGTVSPDQVTSSDPNEGSDTAASQEPKVASRKTYVFDKATKVGMIVPKDGEIPSGDNYATVGKAKWQELCEKYDLDEETGSKKEEDIGDDGDLDLDADTTSSGVESVEDDGLGLEEDDGLDLDEAPALTRDDVKQELRKVMETKGRDIAAKIMKKAGYSNIKDAPESAFQTTVDLCKQVLSK